MLNTFSQDLSYIRRISFFCVKLETSYYNIIQYLGRVLLCEKDTLREIEVIYAEVMGKVDLIWVELQPGIKPGEDARPQAFVIQEMEAERPIIVHSKPPPGAQVWLGPVIGAVSAT